MNPHIHIISFDVPYPADYGGVIDVYYKIKSLFNAGINIHLHCFSYGREKAMILEKYCVSVNYYPRKLGIIQNISTTPYIIKSRISQKLIDNLNKDSHPILCEGMHSCGIILEERIKNRLLIYRASNVEHHYYLGLAKNEQNPFKRLYFYIEAAKLKKWEHFLAKADLFLSVSTKEEEYYKNNFPDNRIENIYPYFEQDNDTIPLFNEGNNFLLFHGNLSVQENEETALYIIENIAPKVNYQIILAGKSPHQRLYNNSRYTDNVIIEADPNEQKMHTLIRSAHINLLLTNQKTGLKLKLLNSLYKGKHCLVNENMLTGTKLHSCVTIGNTTQVLIDQINKLMVLDFKEKDYWKRRKLIPQEFDNKYKSRKLIDLVFTNHLANNE